MATNFVQYAAGSSTDGRVTAVSACNVYPLVAVAREPNVLSFHTELVRCTATAASMVVFLRVIRAYNADCCRLVAKAAQFPRYVPSAPRVQGEQVGERFQFAAAVSQLSWQRAGLVLAVGCEDGASRRPC